MGLNPHKSESKTHGFLHYAASQVEGWVTERCSPDPGMAIMEGSLEEVAFGILMASRRMYVIKVNG